VSAEVNVYPVVSEFTVLVCVYI